MAKRKSKTEVQQGSVTKEAQAPTETSIPSQLQNGLQGQLPAPDYSGIGKADAETCLNALTGGYKSVRELLTLRAFELDNQPKQAEDWLKGYGDACGKDRIMKSRARAVLEAVTKPETMSKNEAHDAVRQFEGSFHAWIDKCREIRGKRKGGKGNGKRTEVSADKLGEMLEAALDFTIPQAQDMVRKCSVALCEREGGETALLQAIGGICGLLEVSEDKGIAEFAKKTGERIEAMVSAATKGKEAETAKAVERFQDVVNPSGETAPSPAEVIQQQAAA